MKQLYFLFILLFLAKVCHSQNFQVTVNCSNPSFQLDCNFTAVICNAQTGFPGSVSYVWTSNTGTFSGTTFSIGAPGQYTVTATTITNSVSTQTFLITQNTVPPQGSVSPTSASVVCPGTTAVTFTLQGSAAPAYQHKIISSLGGAFTGNNSILTYSAFAPGTYTDEISNPFNGCKTDVTFTVNGTGFPTGSVSSAEDFKIGCGSKSITVINMVNASAATPGAGVQYSLFNYPIPPNGGPLSGSINIPGSYIYIIDELPLGCRYHLLFTIESNTLGPLVPLLAGSNTITCANNSLKLAPAYSSSIVSCSWLPFPQTNPSDSIRVYPLSSHTATFIGTYTLFARNNSNYCVSQKTLEVIQDRFLPVATVSVINSGMPELTCLMDTVQLVGQGASGRPANTWPSIVTPISWSGPAPQQPQNPVNPYTAYTAGIYTLSVQDNINSCIGNGTLNITDQRTLPLVTTPPPYNLCENTTITVGAVISSSSTSLLFKWLSPAGAIVQNANSGSLTTNAAGIYTLFVTDATTSCTAVSMITVGICIGIDENENDFEIMVFPNPVANVLKIESERNLFLEFFNIQGGLVLNQVVMQGSAEINLQHLPEGLYYVREKNSGKVIKIIRDDR